MRDHNLKNLVYSTFNTRWNTSGKILNYKFGGMELMKSHFNRPQFLAYQLPWQ